MITLPIEVSARHVHLSKKDLEILFGLGYQLTKERDLSQGQFAAKETLTLKTPFGEIKNVRIVGPKIDKTVTAITASDGYRLKFTPPLGECSKPRSKFFVNLKGPKGEVSSPVIIVHRHIHLDPKTAWKLQLKEDKTVSIKTKGPRALTFHNILIRISPKYKPAFHIDIDEANASDLKTGDKGLVLL